MMNGKSNRILYFMCVMLGIIYTGSYFMPAHYGIKCAPGHAPLGSLVLLGFYVVWTIFVVTVIRNDPLIKESFTNGCATHGKLRHTVQDLMLKSYKGRYDYHKMLLA